MQSHFMLLALNYLRNMYMHNEKYYMHIWFYDFFLVLLEENILLILWCL